MAPLCLNPCCPGRIESARIMSRMGRRFTAVLWLFLLAASNAATWARPILAAEAHQCRCDERLCRCTHRPSQPVVPKCHSLAGTTLPTLQSCDNDEEQALASLPFLLPPQVSLTEPVAVAEIVLPSALRLPAPFQEITPPPPRLPLA